MGACAQGGQEIHREEFVHLVDLSHDRMLIAWGAFWFRRDEADGRWRILDDSELLDAVRRRTCIGHAAEPFGEAHVEVLDMRGDVVAEAGTARQCWVWVEGLEPDSEYRYRIRVDGREWAAGERWDWVPCADGGYDLGPGKVYDLGFRTFPAPHSQTPAMRFVASRRGPDLLRLHHETAAGVVNGAGDPPVGALIGAEPTVADPGVPGVLDGPE